MNKGADGPEVQRGIRVSCTAHGPPAETRLKKKPSLIVGLFFFHACPHQQTGGEQEK